MANNAPRPTVLERLPDRVTVGDCWEWNHPDVNGYGRISVDDRLWLAHRAVYVALVGPIPDGMHLDHLCLNRRCVNPDHLEPVTPAENARRALRGRHQRSGGGDHRCAECGTSFGRLNGLSRHLNETHDITGRRKRDLLAWLRGGSDG